VEPVDGLDKPDGRDLGEVVEPLAPVAEPPRQVLDQRQVQLDQGGPDPGALGVVGRQHGEPFEQLPRLRPVGRGVLRPRQRRRFLADRNLNLDLVFAAQLHPPRRLARTIETLSSGPSLESTEPASADSTVHANVSRAGILASAVVTDTVIVTRSAPSSKTHSRSVPGMAWASSIAHASSIAMRRSSISSRVKSSRAASPAAAVRSTDR